MKLTYRLLWFDDNPDMIETSKEGLSLWMREKGFDLHVESRNEISDAEIEELSGALAQYNPYDIIIFDHDLGARKGTDIARSLRGKIFTDMVYYSAAPLDELRNVIYEAKIDGVFLINKLSCVDDLKRILGDHIKKNCDLNSMRGIVLDAISEMEVNLRKLLIAKLKSDSELRQERLGRFKKRLKGRGKQLQNKADKMTDVEMLSCFADPLKTDFNTIRQILFSCDEEWKNLDEGCLLNELQNLRNVLAHESYKWDQKNNCVRVRIDGQEREYTSATFEEIRGKLLIMTDDIMNHCKQAAETLTFD